MYCNWKKPTEKNLCFLSLEFQSLTEKDSSRQKPSNGNSPSERTKYLQNFKAWKEKWCIHLRDLKVFLLGIGISVEFLFMRCINGAVQKLISCVNQKAVKPLRNVCMPLNNLVGLASSSFHIICSDTIRCKLVIARMVSSNLYKCQPQDLIQIIYIYIIYLYAHVSFCFHI